MMSFLTVLLLELLMSSVQSAPESRQPEFMSPLGKAYFALPETEDVRAAEKALLAAPQEVDRLIAAGRANDGIRRFRRSITLYTRVIEMHPDDVRGYRFRGHRYISTRRFKEALSDLERGRKIAPGSYDVLYHLALAQYLTGQYGRAADTYGRCLNAAPGIPAGSMPADWKKCSGLDDESRVAMLNWRYAALRRAGRLEEARAMLQEVRANLAVKENVAYLKALLFYKGELGEDVLESVSLTGSSLMALGYPVANFALMNGDKAKACALFRKLVSDESNWPAFGFIAAEAELAKGKTCLNQR